jgi:multidrug resistance efflux pump
MAVGEEAAMAADGGRSRRWIGIVLALCLAIFVYNLIADRLTPYSSDATVQAYIVQIAPEVAGSVVEVGVVDNQIVKARDLLFRIDPQTYAAAVREAEAAVDRTGQSIGANTAGVTAAEAAVADARARLANVQEQATRILQLVRRGVYAQARADQTQRQLEGAQAGVRQAEAQLEEARQQLGPQGQDNPELRAALAALERAQLDLAHTVVAAPAVGIVTNLKLAGGQFVAAGHPVMTFIDPEAVWLSANFRENNLGRMRAGLPVEIALDVRPGEVFPGVVESIGWGVDVGEATAPSGLPTIRPPTGWLREAQRFPVRVRFETEGYPKGIRYGSQASVVVYTGDNAVMNALAWLWIRLASWLSYLY